MKLVAEIVSYSGIRIRVQEFSGNLENYFARISDTSLLSMTTGDDFGHLFLLQIDRLIRIDRQTTHRSQLAAHHILYYQEVVNIRLSGSCHGVSTDHPLFLLF
jgi:hypothetical protein